MVNKILSSLIVYVSWMFIILPVAVIRYTDTTYFDAVVQSHIGIGLCVIVLILLFAPLIFFILSWTKDDEVL